MKTYYASPQRQTGRDLDQDIHTITRNPVIDALLHSVAGLVAVLNEYRQIVSVNEAYLRYLGINDPNELLRLRPGESVRCVHATEMPGGCGTSRHCASCGAAIAIVTSLSDEITSERTCAVEVETASGSSDLFFNVRAHPIRIEGRRFTLLFLQDITREQQWAGLERVFLHDIRNSVGSILGWSELLIQDVPQSISEDMKSLHRAARRLARDIELQRDLLLNKFDDLKPVLRKTTAQHVFTALIDAFARHPEATDKTLSFENNAFDSEFKTDTGLLVRILSNMILNALEASISGDRILVSADRRDGFVQFSVWNRAHIPEQTALRIFQRNFSTKPGLGRGIGTYSMKILGEKILGGTVDFSSSVASGTQFRIRLKA